MKTLILFLCSALACLGQTISGNVNISGNVQIGASAGGGGPEIADTFTGTDGTLVGHSVTTGTGSWVVPKGTFNLYSGTVTNAAVAGEGYACAYINHTMSSADYTASIDVNTGSAGANDTVCLAIRYDGGVDAAMNCYCVVWFPGNQEAHLYKVVSGASTSLGNITAIATCTSLWISASGTTITAKINGTQITSVTDSAISAAGYVGIGDFRQIRDNYNFLLDNLSVTVP